MSAININLPDPLRSYLDERVTQGGYKDASEFVQTLLEADQHRKLKQEVEGMLQEAAAGPFSDWSEEDMEDILRTGTRLIEKRRDW